MRIIKVHSLPAPEKEVTEKRKELKPIPIPIPEETEVIISPPIEYYFYKEDLLSDDSAYFWDSEFKPPDYDDILIGVLGRTAKEGERLFYVPPNYPEHDIRAYIQGKIVLKLTVNKRGKVVSTYVVEGVGNVEIEKAAREAALKWLYKPITRKGKPVYFQTEVSFNYSLK